ncbi:MAG: hypothetical protein U0270_23055 [Labilithrix sp.]
MIPKLGMVVVVVTRRGADGKPRRSKTGPFVRVARNPSPVAAVKIDGRKGGANGTEIEGASDGPISTLLLVIASSSPLNTNDEEGTPAIRTVAVGPLRNE